MRIVVTGGAGFIGANLCGALQSCPGVTDVVAFDDLSTGSAANLAGLPLIVGSILDRPLLEDVVAGADAVVHLAARPSVPRSIADPVASHEVNATGTLYVLEACRRAGAHVVAASSSSVYGESDAPCKHEDLPARPLSPYGASKLATEAYALAYASSFGVPVLPLRFFNVYGPLQQAGHAYAAVIPSFVSAALSSEPLLVHGDGRQARDFTFVGTVVATIIDALERRVTARTPVNLAFGTRVSILDLAARVCELAGRPLEVRHAPARTGDIRTSQACPDRLRALFPGVDPVSLDQGLRATVAWFAGLEVVAG
jgi:UDP-glucose 4-epimerase